MSPPNQQRELGELASSLTASITEQRNAHQRLRDDLNMQDAALEGLSARLSAIESDYKAFKATPQSITNLMAPWQMLFGAILMSATIVGGMWAITYEIRSDVRDIKTQQAADAKLADERATGLKESVTDAKKMQELQRIQIESLTKTVLTQGR